MGFSLSLCVSPTLSLCAALFVSQRLALFTLPRGVLFLLTLPKGFSFLLTLPTLSLCPSLPSVSASSYPPLCLLAHFRHIAMGGGGVVTDGLAVGPPFSRRHTLVKKNGITIIHKDFVVQPGGSPPLQSTGRNQKWPKSGPSGYITPTYVTHAALGVPTASVREAQSEVAHKWARWLHNPSRLGGPHRFGAGGTMRGGPQVGGDT